MNDSNGEADGRELLDDDVELDVELESEDAPDERQFDDGNGHMR